MVTQHDFPSYDISAQSIIKSDGGSYPFDYDISPAMFRRQLELEEEMGTSGADAYWARVQKAKDSNKLTATVGGQVLLDRMLGRVIDGIRTWMAEAAQGRAGSKMDALQYARQSTPEIMAYIALVTTIDRMTRDTPYATMARVIGGAVEDDVRLRMYKKQKAGFYNKVEQSLNKRTSNLKYRRRLLTQTLEDIVDEHFDRWGNKGLLVLGMAPTEIVMAETAIVQIQKVGKATKMQKLVVPTDLAQALMQNADTIAAAFSPLYLPTIIPPRPWIDQNTGSYWALDHRCRLIGNKNQNYCDDLVIPQRLMSAVNTAQETAFRVCRPVYDVVRPLYESNRGDAGLPPADNLPIPPKPHDIATNEEAKEKYRKAAGKAYAANNRLIAKRISVEKTLWVADRFVKEAQFYYPKKLDFRGRVYDIPTFMHPQGNDLSKGLLEFSRAKPLGERGIYWLAIHLSNCFGNDKCTLDDRVVWTEEHTQEILQAAEDPMGDKWWITADKPFQFLQACFAWAGYKEEGEDYLCRVPVTVDGSCNGLQNLSAALRDEAGARATNVLPSDFPADIYSIVAEKVSERVEADAALGMPSALGWRGKVDRYVCKRPVMTLPYGACQRGFTEQIMTDTLNPWRLEADEDGSLVTWPFEGDGFQAAKYLADILWEVTGEIVGAAQVVMGWMQECARVVARAKFPVVWHTPMGLRVMQFYPNTRKRRLATMLLGKRIYVQTREPVDLSFDTRKMANSIAPNWTHSIDANHLLQTVERFRERLGSIPDVFLVHDSYGSHACDMDLLSECIRSEFLATYQGNVLENFYADMAEQLIYQPDTQLKLPLPPDLGDLDLEEVMRSAYFFS